MSLYIALVGIIAVLWVIWRKKHLSQFKKLGIPGPEPNIIFGNLLELYFKGPVKCHQEWVQKYGRVLGYFQGMKPSLLIADPQLLKNIFIKDFSKFTNREATNPLYHYDPNNSNEQSVVILPGKKWKYVRSVLTPTFTVAKMKQMSGCINSSIDTMISVMKERSESGQVFDILDTYQRLTMDVITRTAFGLRTDVQTNFKSRILIASKIFLNTVYSDPIMVVGLCWPYLRSICKGLQDMMLFVRNRGIEPIAMLRKGLTEVLEHRRCNPQANNVDILQLMIDTKIYTDDNEVGFGQLEAGNANTENKYSEEVVSGKSFRTMSDSEIISSSVSVFIAGYETTSTALAFTTYFLGKYPDIQDQLYEEIRELIRNEQKLEYATINKLQLLDNILNESMRIYPPVYLFTNRYAVENVQYDDLKIPKGMLIHAPVWLMHHDPEFWEDPETFDPARFNNKPNSYGITHLPFGVGPRNCLGMRFAQLEAKLALAHVFYNFKVTLDERQKDHLEIILRMRTVAPKDGILVKLEPREVGTSGIE